MTNDDGNGRPGSVDDIDRLAAYILATDRQLAMDADDHRFISPVEILYAREKAAAIVRSLLRKSI